jgi:hypothetical protein
MHFFELAEYLHMFRGGTPDVDQPAGSLLVFALAPAGLFAAIALLIG